ncbi:glycosyltransferase family 8 protein [Aulographum hederae CBS 113979]|uniref:Glycosyltransferase family 8 protein n=1 Tax=Aulographum hederae CBS 113979 TaxID=1176131 RepID=A0A6G1H3Y3_9PEZI|nr:glycosyltransferase family 8 protein [Aulographum hederae CBS 113979]
MVLLTPGQVSVAISSFIIFFFTFLLFFAGYTLQQQTVHNLQSIIRPPIPSPRLHIPEELNKNPSSNPASKGARPVGKKHKNHASLQGYFSYAPAVDWSKYAYVQYVRTVNEACSAVMMFEELHESKSPARRMLMFPSWWVGGQNTGDRTGSSTEAQEVEAQRLRKREEDEHVDTSRRLLKKAARRFGVALMPIRENNGDSFDQAEARALSTMFSFTEFKRIMRLSGPGTILNSAPLDSLLAFAPSSPLSGVPHPNSDGEPNEIGTSLLLIQPSKSTREHFSNALTTSPQTANTSALLNSVFPAPDSFLPPSFLSASESSSLMSTTHSLVLADAFFNSSAFLAETGFVKFEDPRLPGPEVSIPWKVKIEVRPEMDGARKVWDSVYERWRSRRMEVCGLDLEAWKEPERVAEVQGTAQGEESISAAPPSGGSSNEL